MESNRIIVFGSTVFKLIYKMSEGATPDEAKLLVNAPEYIQSDIENITAAVLTHLVSTGELIPVRSDNAVIYPGSTPWPSGHELTFYNGDCELSTHPEAILLLVHQTPENQKPEKVEKGSILGKHQRVCPEDEHLPLITGIPPLMALTRKRMKIDEGEEDGGGVELNDLSQLPEMHPVSAVPPPSEAALPTGSQPEGLRDPPSDQSLLQYSQKVARRLEVLSQSAPVLAMDTLIFLHGCKIKSGAEGLESVTEPRSGPFSIFSRVWRWWKFGWRV